MPDLRTRYVGLTLETPLIVASSGLTETVEKMRLCQEHGAGAVVVKSYAEEEVMRISPTPRYRVLHQRLGDEKSFTFMSYEQASRFDIDRYAQEVADAKAKLHIKVIPSILCVTDEGWVKAAQILEEAGADALELNTSCPHGSITFRGKAVEETIFHTVRLVREAVSLPLVVKISSMLTSPIGVVKELEKIGVQGVTIFNRMTALDVNVHTEEIEMPGGYAGHGGPWAIQYPLRWISQIAPQVGIDIAATGGVSCYEDVVKYLLVGATVVQVCTALFFNGYAFLEELVRGLERHMEQKGYERVEDFRGKVVGKILGTYEIDRRHRFDAKIDPSPTAPCKFACPVGVPIQAFVHYVAERDFEKALEMIRSVGPFQSVCGRVCYHPCEDACTRGDMDEPVAIMALKRFVLEWGERNRPLKDVTPEVAPPTGKKVAVVGAGPAGLTAAHDLAKRGHKVVVYEALPVPGGMMAVGIPEYRLPRELVREEIAYIERMGVEIRTGVRVGKDATLEELGKEYDAVFLATGAHRNPRLGIPGEELEGVMPALDFLKKVNLGEKVRVGRRVGVIGGGNTALDAARVALRLGAEEVYLIYRRTKEEMPARAWEVAEAEEEGVRVLYLTAPVEVLGNGRVKAVRFMPHTLGKPDEDGRRRPEPAPSSAFEIPLHLTCGDRRSSGADPGTSPPPGRHGGRRSRYGVHGNPRGIRRWRPGLGPGFGGRGHSIRQEGGGGYRPVPQGGGYPRGTLAPQRSGQTQGPGPQLGKKKKAKGFPAGHGPFRAQEDLRRGDEDALGGGSRLRSAKMSRLWVWRRVRRMPAGLHPLRRGAGVRPLQGDGQMRGMWDVRAEVPAGHHLPGAA